MAGLLADVYSFGNRTRNKLRGLLDDPIGTLQQAADATAEGVRNLTGQNEVARQFALRDRINAGDKNALAEYKQLQGQVNNKLLDLATNFNPAAVGMTAWHGSPHKFDKFDLSKIGTGEGAQAYGHGLYLAESPEVAQSYKTAGSFSHPQIAIDGTPYVASTVLNNRTPHNVAADAYARFGNKKDAIAWLDDFGDGAEARKILKKAKKLEDVTDKQGSLYKTDIPDEAVARFLDWDKPLSQQAPEVMQKLFPKWKQPAQVESTDADFLQYLLGKAETPGAAKLADENSNYQAIIDGIKEMVPGIKRAEVSPDMNFGSIYKNMQQGVPSLASDYLKSKGIPGIRYLDGGSRGTGQGTSNFVIFDPEMIRILERNGEATGAQPWKPGEWEGLLK